MQLDWEQCQQWQSMIVVVVWIVSRLVADCWQEDSEGDGYIAAPFGVESAVQWLETALNPIGPQIVVSEGRASVEAVLTAHIERRAH